MGAQRPFYGSFAWAYDMLVDRPVAAECRFVADRLAAGGVVSGARVLDAGCGTGRYAAELAHHGYRVTGLDRSPALAVVARRRRSAGLHVAVADLAALPLRAEYAAVLCRGVLNDVLDDGERDVILAAFAATVRTGGLLVLDVRDWEATVREKTARPVHERTVETEQGTLTFRSETRLDPAARRLLIAERHVLARAGQTRSEAYEFVMRCWTRDELETRLTAAGFDAIGWHGGYDAAAAPGTGDRLVVVAARRGDDDRGVDCRPSSARREAVAPMPSLLPARTLTVSIDCPPDRVYAFVRNPANLPRFIAFVNAVRETGDRWVAETTQGPLGWAFVPDNDLGVLDHVVTRADSQAILNPMRVVANGGGSEVIFTLFHRPGMTVVQFAEDAALVERDLLTLKRVLESGGVR